MIKRKHTKKLFRHGDQVRVKLPGRRAFYGKVYSEYKDFPWSERMICVTPAPLGAGVAYLVRYVTKAEPKGKR